MNQVIQSAGRSAPVCMYVHRYADIHPDDVPSPARPVAQIGRARYLTLTHA